MKSRTASRLPTSITGGAQPALDLGDLARERALRERLAAPGPVWWKVRVSTTRMPPAGPYEQRERALRDLAHGVGRGRAAAARPRGSAAPAAGTLPYSSALPTTSTARPQAGLARGVEQVHDAEHVRAQRAAGVEPRLLDARLAGQVHDRVRARLGDHGRRGGRVVEVGLDEARARARRRRQAAARRDDAVDLDARLRLAPQQLEQVAADEAAGAGDEQPQR